MKVYFAVLLAASIVLPGCGNKENKLVLTCDSSIARKDLKVSMEAPGSVPVTTIYDGEKEFQIPNGYGENEWYFSYQDSLKGYLRHIKLNANHGHVYRFFVYDSSGQKKVKVDIEGADDMEKTLVLK